ncbi:MAG: sialate O-acetylesterase [Verrucomicrobia bacterium]|nr:sialate O-acetylesterase [Verrucomicrobiota bacterium]
MNTIATHLAILLALGTFAAADVRLPNLFSDHMVLQRDKALKVWGWAAPGEQVKVLLAGQSAATSAAATGEWKVTLPAMPAGGPHELTVTGSNTVRVTDILVGEVWICSGQSNMEFELKHALNAQQEIRNADYPKLRMLWVPRTPAALPLNDIKARWFVCSPEHPSVAEFSAVAYFFGREIHQALKVPVGMIAASQGATQIELWTAPEGLAGVPALQGALPGINAAAEAARKKLADNLDTLEAAIPQARAALAQGRPLPPGLAMANPLPAEGGPVLYHGMIYPLVPFAIRGALWYQGESNCGDGMRYLDKMKALIGGWRQVWQQGDPATGSGRDFPFYFVQITPNTYDGRLPFLLEAQAAAMAIPNTGMAASTDTCNASDHFGGGHPANKQEIGRRLALWALAKDYGQKNLVYCGPQYQALKAEGKQLRISFDSVGGGLVTKDSQPPDSFEIAGAEGNFVTAVARIEGATVVLSSDKVAKPVAMRFAWKDLAQPNLMNKEGLPVSVFRAELGP